MALRVPCCVSILEEREGGRGLLSSFAVKLFACDLSSMRSYWKSKSSPGPLQPIQVGSF